MKTFIVALFTILSSSAYAKEPHHPRPFPYKSSKAVFLDFKEASYDITIDPSRISGDANFDTPLDELGNGSVIKARIIFDMPEEGYPVFDNYYAPRKVFIDGKPATQLEVTPPGVESELRVVQMIIKPGRHVLEIETIPYADFLNYTPTGGLNIFSAMGDNEPRGFLEYVMPASFEYDQVKMRMRFHILGNKKEHRLYANGAVKKVDFETFEVEFPETFTASSPFYHLISADNVEETHFAIKSIDGRTIPAAAYFLKDDPEGSKKELLKLVSKAKKAFAEAEKKLGAYAHSSMVIYHEGGKDSAAGMEYSGAMRSDTLSVTHEVFHSWYGRGAMPANGNAAWIDESVVVWMDDGDPRVTELTPSVAFAGISLPYYHRENGSDAYNGVAFLSYLHNVVLKSKGGLYPFLREFYQTYKNATYSSEDFIRAMSSFAGEDLNPLFEMYAGKKYVPYEFSFLSP